MTPGIPGKSQQWELTDIPSQALTESGILSTHSHDEHVERDNSAGDVALDFRIIADMYDAVLVVDLGGLGFIVLNRSLLVTKNVSDGLHDRTMLDQASCT